MINERLSARYIFQDFHYLIFSKISYLFFSLDVLLNFQNLSFFTVLKNFELD